MCVYFGDIHNHTGYSDGQGTPEQAYQMARDNGLDFFSLSDHAELLTDAEWELTLVQAISATVEGQYIAMRGFEWTSEGGHHNVYGTNSFVSTYDPEYDEFAELYAWLSEPDQINSMAQFDHPYYPPHAFNDFEYVPWIDPHMSLIESQYGNKMRVKEYKEALAAGWHVGLGNNADAHTATWGVRNGRTSIIAPALTHYQVIEALRLRRTFATEDVNLALAMRADGYWMGSVLRDGPLHLEIYASDPDPGDEIATLYLYRNNEVFSSTIVNATSFSWTLSLPAPSPPGTWWYAQATQHDGKRAFTSPIWTFDPQPHDVMIRDNVWDVGDVPSAGPGWQSPDIWVRRQPDGQMWHQNPAPGATNYVHARVENAGTQALTDVYVSFYWAHPSLGLSWPEDWHAINTLPIQIPELSPGETRVVSVPWNAPLSTPEYTSLLVRLFSAQDPVRSAGHSRWHNNLAWKNVHIIDLENSLPPTGTLALPNLTFYLANPSSEAKTADLRLSSGEFPAQGRLTLHLGTALFDRWMATESGGLVQGALVDPGARTITVTYPIDASVYGLPLEAGERTTVTLSLAVPPTATLSVRVSEEIDRDQIGGALFTTAFSQVPRKVDLTAAVYSVAVSQTVPLTAVVVGEGFVPVPDGTQVQFSTTLGELSADTALTRNGLVTVTLNTEKIPGTAIVRAGVGGWVTGTAVIEIHRTCWARLNEDATDYATIQAAVDASTHVTDVVKVAGRCDTLNDRGGSPQVLYLNKTLTVRGGYTETNWSTFNPASNLTTLDAHGQGRAIYVTGPISPTVEGLTLTGGDASGLGGGPSGEDAGGGAYVTAATVTFLGNRVIGNRASIGGGLYLASGDFTLANNVIADNTGHGLHVAGASARLWHTTIVRNDTGVHVTDAGASQGTVALTNTILVSHAVGINVTAGNTAALGATLWGTDTWANGIDWGGAGAINVGAINIWDDPAFEPTDGRYGIGPDSGALDAGLKTVVEDDIDGEPRPMGHGYDIGADEFNIALALAQHADPDPVEAGAPLTFTIQITNTGKVDLHTVVTDILPAHVVPGETLTWTPTITAPGGTWTQQVVVTVERDYGGPLVNVVRVRTDEGPTASDTQTVTAEVEYPLYMPVVMRNMGPPEFCAPQLVAEIAVGPEPRGIALDTVGGRAFVAHADGVTVIDTASLAVITETRTFTSAFGIAYDPDQDRIWVTRRNPDRVLALDGATYTTLADLPAGRGPHGVAYNPANERVYVTNYMSWTVGVYHAGTLAHVIDLNGVAEPAHLAIDSAANKIYVANHWPSRHVTVIDGATHDTRVIETALLDAYGVAADASRKLVYATAIAQARLAVIDATTDTQLGYLEMRRGDGEVVPLRVVAVNPDLGPGGHLLVVTSSEDGGRDQLLLIPGSWPNLGTPVPLDLASYPLEGIAVDSADRVWITSVESGLVTVVQDGEPLCDIPFSAQRGREITLHMEVFFDP